MSSLLATVSVISMQVAQWIESSVAGMFLALRATSLEHLRRYTGLAAERPVYRRRCSRLVAPNGRNIQVWNPYDGIRALRRNGRRRFIRRLSLDWTSASQCDLCGQ